MLRSLVKILVGEYEIYRVFSLARSASQAPKSNPQMDFVEIVDGGIGSSQDELIRQQAWYAGTEARAYAGVVGNRIVGICFYWWGDRYRTRNFWPLKSDEAKLVQIVTVPDMRGRGIARYVIEQSASRMFELGYRKLYARVWHSNTPSMAAFKAAGWSPVSLVITFNPLRMKKTLRLQWPWRAGS